MHLLFCHSHLYVHKFRTLEVPDGNLALKLLHFQTFLTPYCRCQVDTLEPVTGRRLDQGRHEEDIKGHLDPFLPDSSLVSEGYPFLTFTKICPYTMTRQPVSYRGITFGYRGELRCR
jgi:hypothetical protein